MYAVRTPCLRRSPAARSVPMLRPLAYLWPEDATAAACEDEFLLGDDLLAAPLLEENAAERSVYLPQGDWVGLFDRRQYRGGGTVVAGEPGRMPVFVRPYSKILEMKILAE